MGFVAGAGGVYLLASGMVPDDGGNLVQLGENRRVASRVPREFGSL